MRGVRGDSGHAGRVPPQPELDRPARLHADRRRLRAAAAGPADGVPRRLGEVPARRRRSRRSSRRRSRTTSSRPSIPSSTATAVWAGCSITLLLVARGVLPSPLLYLSAWFEATRDEYYARLSGVTERGEWEEWLGYFLTGAAEQAEDAVGRIGRIDALLARWREELAKASSRLPERAIDLFAENPYWTVNRLAARLGVAFTTAQRAIDRLEAAGIVTLAGPAKRNRVYCARAILEVLEEPSRLDSGRPRRRGRRE